MGLPENIDALLVKYDITQEALARIADVSPSSVTRWRRGSNIRKEPLKKICAKFNLTEDDLLSDSFGLAAKEHGTANRTIPYKPTSAMVPLVSLGSVHAGELTQEAASEREIEVPANVAGAHPNAIALEVDGDCMNRVIPDGAHILVDPDLDPANGSIVVAETQDYDAVMRRWYKGSSTLMLTADSFSEHDDIVMGADDGPVRVLGVVVWFQAPGEMD